MKREKVNLNNSHAEIMSVQQKILKRNNYDTDRKS